MTDDRYVIVYRDGHIGPEMDRWASTSTLMIHKRFPGGLVPAYRIRCRKKPRKVEQYPSVIDHAAEYKKLVRRAWDGSQRGATFSGIGIMRINGDGTASRISPNDFFIKQDAGEKDD